MFDELLKIKNEEKDTQWNYFFEVLEVLFNHHIT